ncbi:MAG: hypothetical protein MI974_32445 [Chitinophagales bacterium]|nr:hypothetical protein [Chitinophagales bacterium]
MNKKRIVLKFGTTSVCNVDTLDIREDWVQSVAYDVKELLDTGAEVIIFSSGGLATGKKRGRPFLKEQQLQNKNLLGAIGLNELLYKWQKNFDIIGLPTATLAIREEDVSTTSVCTLIAEMTTNGIVPIINENIPLQDDFNNDELAATICQNLNASQFVLFTDTDGIFTDNPKTNPDAKHLKEIDINDVDINLGGETSGLGSGGMKAKLASAIKVKKTGVDTIIANGTDLHPLKNLKMVGKYTLLKE